ncbi:D-isomer specific 2-hydroxyacid dehydrogenase [Aspergillus avenaceus]|uniref:D-isomer specific 2-hydroxyacid dehydrogenase n=1 Tax=Aspergillus avenaceus TaxID=36643 RepID=A0A5N6TZ19_ASPAV|nr:D-isomer specific 2-hydroxyacid dehydrogenase [Aspergillus avenaceus]
MAKSHHIVDIEAVHCPISEFDIPGGYTLSAYKWTEQSDLASRIKHATIVLTTTIRIPAAVLSPEVTPNLRLIVIMASGTDCVDKEAAKARGITVCNCPGTNIDSVSEHAIGLYFAARRRLVGLHNTTVSVPEDITQDTEWKMHGGLNRMVRTADGEAPLTCEDETVGIIGYGSLGKRIHTLATSLGMDVRVAERKGEAPRPGRVSFEETLKSSTVVILCLPRTPQTTDLISTAELHLMSRQALLIHVGRGGIVDEQALLEALKGGVISGAAMDVYAIEPAGRGTTPLLGPDAAGLNLVMTPHLAWYSKKTLRNLEAATKTTVESWSGGNIINQVV